MTDSHPPGNGSSRPRRDAGNPIDWRGADRRRAPRRRSDAERRDELGLEVIGAAHDLNNVFGVIRANLELVRAYLPEPDRAAERLCAIDAAISHAEAVSGTFLEAAGTRTDDPSDRRSAGRALPGARGDVREPEGAPESATTETASEGRTEISDLNEILSAIAEFLHGALPSGVELAVAIDARHPHVAVPRVDVERIVVNLVTNAVNAVCGEGTITIASADEVVLSSSDGPSSARLHSVIRVIDTGAGLDDEALAKVTSTVPTRSTRRGGHGVGLPACHEMAARSGGWLDAARRTGGGTIFSVHFPTARRAVATASRPVVPSVSGRPLEVRAPDGAGAP